MSRDYYRRQFGDRNMFAIEISLGRPPYGSSRDWGGLGLWVEGRCLTQAVDIDGGVTESVSTELGPVLRWMSSAAVRLVNEEPLPHHASEVADACDWYIATEVAPAAMDEQEETKWFTVRSEWRRHHALRRSTLAAALPNVVWRRLGADVEVSWDNERWGTSRPTLRFVERRGTAYVRAEIVAETLRAALQDIATPLGDAALVVRDARRSDWRWLVHEATADKIRKELPSIADRLDRRTAKARSGLFVPHQPETWLLRQSGPLSAADLRRTLRAADKLGESPLREEVAAAIRVTHPSRSEPWREGYERALEFRAAMGWGDEPLPDLARWLRRKGASASSLVLPDSIDLICRRAEDGRAAVTLNRHGKALRHELGYSTGLGHLLMDPARVSIDGRYEHWPSAARARAFGVMLTLPVEGVKRRLGKRRIDGAAVRDLMQHFSVGPYATTFHLKNHHFIDEPRRIELLGEVGA